MSSDDPADALWDAPPPGAADSSKPHPYAGRFQLEGHWRLNTEWRPFTAELVIHATAGFVWTGRAEVGKVIVRGFERWWQGRGTIDWRLFGRVPALVAEGPDVDRSMRGRFSAETILLPPPFTADAPELAREYNGESLVAFSLERWGNPDGGESYGLHRYGGTVEAESLVDGVRIPTSLTVGWHPGSEEFEELFRFQVLSGEYRVG